MEHTSVVGDPHYQCDSVKLENVQRRAARFCKVDSGGGVLPYWLYRYVRVQRVWFYSRFRHE